MPRHIAIAAIAAACLLALTACDSGDDKAEDKPSPSPTTSELTQKQKDEISKAAGMPPRPTGAERQRLLKTLAAVAPDVVRYEDKAVDAARNQCRSINDNGAKVDWAASMRFTYKDVKTTEAQGAKINDALKKSGFCNV
ncbi:hypothetical protein [Streptomyces sp. DASNCL29]|uniref:hypothetical protein n=1 Tax=Streptomyces sp. DASNCL29 TaxID=2583819 RepID=UPI00110F8D66|nr:hypothetical protein [Streptomyces sp. DASNCL29]TMU98086.1 hypothetical protein FGK60_09670 [Streptomyces sp. DASNCL29]